MSQTYYVSTGVDETADMINRAVVDRSVTGECIDRHRANSSCGQYVMLVFEKLYGRVSNRLTLTVLIDDFEGKTKVHFVSGGGGQSVLFRFDWGAASSFSSVVERALRPYIV